MKSIILPALLVLLLPACATLPPPTVAPAWSNVGAATNRLQSLADLRPLADQFPESAAVQLRLLTAAHKSGDKEVVRAQLRRLDLMGYAVSNASFEQVAVHLTDSEVAELRARFEGYGRPVEASSNLSFVPIEGRLIEGVVRDAPTGRLFASSVVGRELWMFDKQWAPVPGIDSGSLTGLAVDETRRLLWMASGAVRQTPLPGTAFRGLIAMSLKENKIVRRIEVPSPEMFPGDILAAPDGTIYASDSGTGAIMVGRPGVTRLSVLLPAGHLRSPQGLVLSRNGKHLYVADYDNGIAIVDLASGHVSRLAAAKPMMLNGIDGLYAYGGGLIAIQNGTSPRRIVALQLDRAGTGISNLHVIEQNHHSWGEPTNGYVDQRAKALIYVSDAQWERFDKGGTVRGSERLRPTLIRKVKLGKPVSRQRS
ncbi:MAG: hypothetical protein H0W74_10360 [Sphingosinicella sp.]|nr:hypothetical protein [Sphingosinicella sp.]